MDLLWWKKESEAPGVTWNRGEPMRLKAPFDEIAIYDGAIHLRSSHSSGPVLMVPKNGRAYLTGIHAEAIDDA